MAEVYDNRGVQEVELSGGITSSLPQPSTAQTIITRAGRQGPTLNAEYVIYTPTAGKTLYITSFILSCGASQAIRIGDNLSGNADISSGTFTNTAGIFLFPPANSVEVFTFPTPMPVATELSLIVGGTSDVRWSFIGYEVAN